MDKLHALLEISRRLPETQTRQEVLYLLVKAIASVIRVTRCSVILVDEASGRGSVLATFEDPTIRELPILLDKYPEIRQAVQTGETVLVEDAPRDSRLRHIRPVLERIGIASILVIPIMFYDRVLGTLFLRTSSPNQRFSRDEILFCETASRMAANFLLGLTQYQLVVEEKAKLAEEALTDSLTAIGNRSAFVQALNESFAYARRSRRPLSCLLIDVDDFKSLNDRLGHGAGDRALQHIAHTIMGAIRQSDMAARYGGDEFVVLLPDTDGPGAFTKAERIRKCVASIMFSDHKRPLRVSIGIATWTGRRDRSPECDLLAEADHALYEAKGAGKNCTRPSHARKARRPSRKAA